MKHRISREDLIPVDQYARERRDHGHFRGTPSYAEGRALSTVIQVRYGASLLFPETLRGM